MKIYTDEHISKAIIIGLRKRGVDVLSVHETGMYAATDTQHLQMARNEGRILLTRDKGFLRLNAERVVHSGIVYARHGLSIGEIIRGLILIHGTLGQGGMNGHVEFL